MPFPGDLGPGLADSRPCAHGEGQIAILVRKAGAGRHGTARTLAEASVGADLSRLIDGIAWKLAEMPLPRLQHVGDAERRFLYEIGTRIPDGSVGESDQSSWSTTWLTTFAAATR